MRKLQVSATSRVSFYIYNNKEEIDLFVQAMCEAQMSLHEIKQGMQIYPQTLINVRLPAGNTVRSFDLAKSDALRSAVKRAESELGDNGRVLLRPSGTEPVIRVMVEGMDEQQVSRIGEDLADQVRATSI